MNRELFETYFSDLVLYTLSEQPAEEEEDQQPAEEEILPEEQIDPASGRPIDPNTGDPIPAEPIEVEGDDMVNVAPKDPLADPTQVTQIKISLGRIYELKKIYTKLLSISKLLDSRSDIKYSELEKETDDALDMFHVISLNLDKFQPKIDDIIVEFYRFIKRALEELEQLSKTKVEN
jgi:hypothetical protein